MNASTHETPSIFSKTRMLSNWLEPPEVINTNDSRISVQLEEGHYRIDKSDQVAQPTSQDEFMRELSKVRLDVRHSRRRLDASTQQLNQSKSTDSLSNKNRLQFIQQKFKEKDELLVLQQNIIRNLKRDIRHRDRIIQTIGEAPQHEEMGASRGIVTNHNISRQEDALLKKLRESGIDQQRKSRVEHNKPPQRKVQESPAIKHQQILSFVSDIEPEYNVRVFPSEEEMASSQLIQDNQARPQLGFKMAGSSVSATSQLRERLARLTKEHEASRIEHRSHQTQMRQQLEKKIEEYEKLALQHQLTQKQLNSVRSVLEKVKHELECSTKLLQLEKGKSIYAERKAKEFDVVEKSLRTALNTRDAQIKQLTHEITQLRMTPKVETKPYSPPKEQLKPELEATKIQLISKDLELNDLRRLCQRLKSEINSYKELETKHYHSSHALNNSCLRIEETKDSRVKTSHKSPDKPLREPPAAVKPTRPKKPERRKHNCLDSTLHRSKSITYYPTIKWNRVIN